MARAEMLGLTSVVLASMGSSGCYWGARSCSVESERALEKLLESGGDLSNCELVIARTDLPNLDLLEDLDEVREIYLLGNSLLTNLSGILSLKADYLNAARNPLGELHELPHRIPRIEVQGADVTALSWEPEPGDAGFTLILEELPLLESLSVPTTPDLDWIYLDALPLLPDLQTAFPVTTRLGRLDVKHCPLVTTAEIEALAALVEDKDRVHHCGNADDEPCPEEVAED